MRPPTSPIPPGGTTTGRQALTGVQLEMMLRAAHTALAQCGIDITPMKVNRIVRNFAKALARTGKTFHEFLCDEANATDAQRHLLLLNPEWAKVIAYTDPTGEKAVNNVMHSASRGRGYRG